MAMKLGVLGERREPGRRAVTFPWGIETVAVAGRAEQLPAQAMVLLEGRGDTYVEAHPVSVSRWFSNLPSFGDLPATGRSERVTLAHRLSSHGTWTVDPSGLPCELGRFGQRLEGVVMNFSGWRLQDIQHLEVEVYAVVVGTWEVLLIAPDAVQVGTLKTNPPPPPEPPRRQQSVWLGPASQRVVLAKPIPADPPPKPAPASDLGTHRLQFRLVELTFQEGSLCFSALGRRFEHPTAISRAVFEPLKAAVARDVPFVRATVLVESGSHRVLSVDGLEDLERLFKRVRFNGWQTGVLATPGMQDLEEVLESMPTETPDRFQELCSLEAFGMSSRAWALRELYGIRDQSRATGILPGKSLLFPVRATDAGATWFVWETFDNDRATYVFRPKDEVTLSRLTDWLSADGRREVLLGSDALQQELGYVRRVFHRHEDWWSRVRVALGLSR
jgi:hypothetical protein